MSNMPPAYEGDKPYIFISYAHKNTDKVMPAIQALEEVGYPVWYDAGIQVGTEWPEYIARHLLNCSLVIAFISKESIASPNCRQEIVYALDKRKPIITVHLDEEKLPPGMEMQLNLCQALLAYKHPTVAAYVAELIKAPFIGECLACTPKEEQVEKAIEAVSASEAKEQPKAGGKASKDASSAPSKLSVFFKKCGKAIIKFFDTEDETHEYKNTDIEDNKFLCILCYLGILVLIPVFLREKKGAKKHRKHSRFICFHVNQGILLSASWLACFFVSWILSLLSGGILFFLMPVVNCFFFLILCVSLVHLIRGKAKEIPVIGQFRIVY